MIDQSAARIPSEAWRCSNCYAVHDDEDNAYECCPPTIKEGYRCPYCGDFCLSKDDALNCCEPPPEDELGIIPTAAQLEAAGQMRLVP